MRIVRTYLADEASQLAALRILLAAAADARTGCRPGDLAAPGAAWRAEAPDGVVVLTPSGAEVAELKG